MRGDDDGVFAGALLLLDAVLEVAFWATDGEGRGVCAGLGAVRALGVEDFGDTIVPFVSGLGGAGTGGISDAFDSAVPFVVVSAGAGRVSVFTGWGSGCIGCITGDLKRNEGGSEGTSGDSVTGFGGHSRFSLSSSLAESPVIWETTLELLGEDVPVGGWRLDCVSNRPIRFATLWRGRSSGRGLMGIEGSDEWNSWAALGGMTRTLAATRDVVMKRAGVKERARGDGGRRKGRL